MKRFEKARASVLSLLTKADFLSKIKDLKVRAWLVKGRRSARAGTPFRRLPLTSGASTIF